MHTVIQHLDCEYKNKRLDTRSRHETVSTLKVVGVQFLIMPPFMWRVRGYPYGEEMTINGQTGAPIDNFNLHKRANFLIKNLVIST
jgi:hypothetical protein